MNKKKETTRMVTTVAGLAVLLTTTAAAAAADGPASSARARAIVRLASTFDTQTDYWIGVLGVPVDETLKSHLKVESGLVVQDIVADSPAAAAAVQKHDVLLKFNNASITDLETLAAAIAENSDAEANLTLIRAGKTRNVKITPARRPAGEAIRPPLPRGDWGSVESWLERLRSGEVELGPMQMWLYGPGIGDHENLPQELRRRFGLDAPDRPRWMATLPAGTSITVTKPGDDPAQIVVKRGEETWTVDENQLDQLPEDLRGPVRNMLESGTTLTFRPGDLPRIPWREQRPVPPRPRWNLKPGPNQPADEEAGDGNGAESWGRRLEELQNRIREQQQRMEQEIERLRRDWQQQTQPEA